MTVSISAEEALSRAAACIQLSDYDRAQTLCKAVIASEPRNLRALYLMGTIAFESDDPQAAIQWLERALDADPGARDIYPYLESVYLAEGRPADAAQTTVRAQAARAFFDLHGSLPHHLQDYQRLVESLRTSAYMEFPREIAIETMAVCNAACSFCPYPQLQRKGERMPDALVEKIIEDLGDIPRALPFVISPFKVNDPLLDVRIFDILERCNERLPNAKLRMFTNASPLTSKHIARLNKVQNLEHLWISLNHHDPLRYEQVMQLPWKRTMEKLELLHAAVAAGELSVPVYASRVGDGSADDEAFAAFVRERFPLFKPLLVAQSTWLGQVEGLLAMETLPAVGCGRWFELSITATGEVAFCCMDGKAEYPIGDVAKSHVLEVYNAPAFRVYREKFATRLEGAPCSVCTNR